MTLEQKIGQLFVCGWVAEADEDASTVTRHAEYLLNDMQVGGLVLLPRNVAKAVPDSAKTQAALQQLSNQPLFICVDQEGGMITRFIEGVTTFPSAMAHSATCNSDNAYKTAYANAQELRALGTNWNFAPVADVNINPLNPIIGTRSYGENPKTVGDFVAAAVRGHNDGGVISAVKHFPGHGDTAVDSHLALPTVPYSFQRIQEVELVPFVAAINAGTPAIMTTHIVFPAIDPERPATLSHKVMTGLLREQLGFTGLIITDCLEMKAIEDNYGVEAAVLAFEAGVDLLLVCHTPATQRAMYAAVLAAVQSGRISLERVEQSLARIRQAKEQFIGLPAVDQKVISCTDHLALRNAVAERAVTVVKNSGIIPLQAAAAGSIVVTGLHFSVENIANALKAWCPDIAVVQLMPERAFEQIEELVAKYSTIIMATAPLEPWRDKIDVALQAQLVNYLNSHVENFIAVAVREPYDARNFSDIRNYICIYGYRGGMLEALAKVIAGAVTATGQLPVTIPNVAALPVGENVSENVLQKYF